LLLHQRYHSLFSACVVVAACAAGLAVRQPKRQQQQQQFACRRARALRCRLFTKCHSAALPCTHCCNGLVCFPHALQA
jgi:hypothetical protein